MVRFELLGGYYVTHTLSNRLRDLCVCEVEFFGRCVLEEGATSLFLMMWFLQFSTHYYQIVDLESVSLFQIVKELRFLTSRLLRDS